MKSLICAKVSDFKKTLFHELLFGPYQTSMVELFLENSTWLLEKNSKTKGFLLRYLEGLKHASIICKL